MKVCLVFKNQKKKKKKKKKQSKDVLWKQTSEASDSFLIALLILLVQVCATRFQMSSHGGEGLLKSRIFRFRTPVFHSSVVTCTSNLVCSFSLIF